MHFEPFVGALHNALMKRLLHPPSDWPAPDRAYRRLQGSRYQVHLSVSTQVGLHLFWAYITYKWLHRIMFRAKLKHGNRAVGTVT